MPRGLPIGACMERQAAGEGERARRFPCESCGAELELRPGAPELACPYCGFVRAIPLEPDAVVEERDLEANLARLARQRAEGRGPEPEVLEVRCRDCGATVLFRGTLTSQACAYCGGPIQRTDVHRAAHRAPVDAVLPFEIDRERARERVGRWLRSRWLAPGEFLKKRVPERLQAVYVPFWTFDAAVFARYRGRRGIRRDKKIRWTRSAGRFQHFFDDFPVPADSSMPRALLERLEPWPLERCQPYRPDYLAGCLAKTYDAGLEESWKRGREGMEREIHALARGRIGGDVAQLEECRIRWDALTYKHLLLPVWLLAIRFRGKPHVVVVNGATGEVKGQRPLSVVKLVVLTAGAVGLWLLWRGLEG